MKPILIVGYGVAGAALARHFSLHDIPFHIISNLAKPPSSWAALGLITPRTGRRFTKPWKSNDSLNHAFDYYSQIAEEFAVPLFSVRSTMRFLTQEHEIVGWQKKKNSIPPHEVSEFHETPAEYTDVLCKGSGVVVHDAGSLDISTMLACTSESYRDEGKFTDAIFPLQETALKKTSEISWMGERYEKIIFCEGWDIRQNSLWSHIPISFLKGEILIVDIPAMPTSMAVKRHITLVPLPKYFTESHFPQSDNLFIIGATHERDFATDAPTERGKSEITHHLEELIRTPFSIIEHRSGVRPTVKGTHPVVGFHKDFPHIGIFNGFGTKGVTLSPYCAKLFVEHIIDGTSLPSEIHTQRFHQNLS